MLIRILFHSLQSTLLETFYHVALGVSAALIAVLVYLLVVFKKRQRVQEQTSLMFTEQIATVLKHASVIVFACDQSGHITLLAGHELESLGQSPHDYKGRLVADVYRDDPAILANIKRALAGEAFSVHVTTKESVFEAAYSPLWDSRGRINGCISVASDISDRTQVEMALRESEARFRRFTEATVDGIVIHDQGAILDANSSVASIFQYAPEALLGMHLLDLVSPLSHDIVRKHIAAGYERAYEVLGQKRDGLLFPLELCSKAMPSQGQTIFATTLRDITSYKFVEAALRSSEERFRQLAEHIDQAFWMASSTFDQMIYVSPAYETIWGRSCIDVYENPRLMLDTIHPEEQARMIRLSESYLSGTSDEEYRIVRPDMSVRWVRSRSFPIPNDQGTIYRIAGISEDITERKRVANALAESEATIRELYSIASAHHIDFDARVLALLEMGCKRFDLPTGILSRIEGDMFYVLAAKTSDGSVHAGDVYLLENTYCSLTIHANEPVDIIHAAASSWKNHPCYASTTLEAYLGTPVIVRGHTYGTLCFMSHLPHQEAFVAADKDVLRLMSQWVSGAIEQHLAAQELEEQYRTAERARSETRALLDSTSEGIALVAPEGVLLTINRRIVELFGIRAEQIIGRPVADLARSFPQIFDDTDAFVARIATAIESGERQFTDMVTQYHPVQRELAVFSTSVTMGNDEYLGQLYVFRDVTHERAVDRMKSDFVSLVSHELRTPLTSIKGYIDILLDGEIGPVPDEQREFLTVIKSNANRLVALINDLLDVAKIESGGVALRYGWVSIDDVIANVVALLYPQITTKRQTLTVDLDPQLPRIYGDADRILQIMTNLVSNAHKYTPPAGHIQIRATAEDETIRICVQDDGIGLSDVEQSHLFTRFYRARNRATQEAGGTGLGLSITRSLIELHGGTINVTSAAGAGTSFSFTLPITPRSAPSEDLNG